MNDKQLNAKQSFDTEPWYAIFSGWLILPALSALFAFIGAILIVTFVNPQEVTGYKLAIYIVDSVSLPLLFIVFYLWFTRRRVFPIVISLFFTLRVLFEISLLILNKDADLLSLAMNTVWIIYFLRSKRVKATFTK